MKRYASHLIVLSPAKVYYRHYIELDENNCIAGIFLLTEEIAGTGFYNGILFPASIDLQPAILLKTLNELHASNPQLSIFELLDRAGVIIHEKDTPVAIYQLDGINLFPPELSTGNCSCNSYIQRL